MSSKNIDNSEEVNSVNSGSSSSTSKIKSATSSRVRHSQKLSWIPSTEKETYRTVVVNYRYAKMDKSYPRCTSSFSKRKHWDRMIAAMTATQNSDAEEDDDDDAPNLRRLYDCAKEDLDMYETPDTPMPSCENITASCAAPTNEAIKLEVYCLPVEQEAAVEEPQLNTIEESEVESVTLRDEDYNDDEDKSQECEPIYEATDNSMETASCPTCTDFVLLGDNGIDELQDFNADFCCAMTKDKGDGTEGTCIIKNITKATQNPERHNERLQTTRLSRKRVRNMPSPKNDENSLQLTIAEIPKDSSNSKCAPPQGGFRQRQQELHRYRIAVEQKRLELLEVKLQREREEMLREEILFEKEFELKATQLKQLIDDKTVDIL
ncbi:uncharacterized protein LOC129235990 [Anastrepha obliqua]|uniref:uncharacterized protein LOC129235990 n=1 Tax=Anastrepha obliqua TaxID=95512 RepID=UPI0024098B46|nr:uncharacterized protein LOC129235990 [Anastrepha obliqua]